MVKKNVVLPILILLSFGETLWASEVEKIQIYGSRSKIYGDPWDSKTIIQREMIEGFTHLDLADLLSQVAGIELFRTGSQAGSASLFLRGSESKHVLVYINDIKVNDPSDPSKRFDFSRFPASLIESIEISRGPQSGRFGSESVGGVIRIWTLSHDRENIHAEVGYGSFDRSKVAASYQGQIIEDLTIALAGGLSRSQGYSAVSSRIGGDETDGFQSHELSLSSKYEFDDHNRLEFNTVHTELKNDEDLAQTNYDDPNAESRRSLEIYSLAFKNYTLRSELTISSSYSHSDSHNRNPLDPINNFESNENYIGNISFSEANYSYFGKTFMVSSGLQYESEDLRSQFNNLDLGKKLRDELSVYGEYHRSLWQRMNMKLRLRADEFRNTWRGSYYLSLSFPLSQNIQTSLVSSSGHKKPSLYELFSNFGNPQLDTEFVSSQEINLSYTNKLLKSSIHFFQAEISNLIQYQSGAYRNISQSRQSGMEFRNFISTENSFSINSTIRYLESIDKETNRLLLRRPRLFAQVSFNYQFFKNLRSRLSYHYVGERNDIDFVNFETKKLPSYDLLNLSLSHRLSRQLSLNIMVNNLLNENYESVDGYSNPQINYFLGLKWDKSY